MAANILLPMAANALGLKDMFVRNLPYSLQGIGSFLTNPVGTIAKPIFERMLPEGANPYSNAIPNQSAFGSYAREAIADYLPKPIGDIVSPERVMDSYMPPPDYNLVPAGGGLYNRVYEGPQVAYTYTPPINDPEEYLEGVRRMEEAARTADLGSFEDMELADYISELTPEEWNERNFPVEEQVDLSGLDLGSFEDLALVDAINNLDLGNLDLGNLDFDAGNFDFGGFGDTGGGFFGGSDDDYFMQMYAKGGPVKRRKVVA